MSSATPYQGPVLLGLSKYASPQPNKLSPVASLTPPPCHAQLASAQGDALRTEVNKRTARFATVVSTTATNTRRLLHLIREASPEATNATIDALWKELEDLYAALNDAKAALPTFLERQRNSLSLYHTSMMNQMIQDTQNELEIQHKKVNIQHNLILEHQEAFQAYREQTAAKLGDIDNLQDRVSRLQLEKGNLRSEVDKFTQLLEEERSTKAELVCESDDSKKQLLAEIDILRKKLQGDGDKVNEVEQASQGTAEQLKLTTDQLAQQMEKITKIQETMTVLEERESTARLDAEKRSKENKALNDKYSLLAEEHARAFTKLNEQTKEMDSLKSDIARFQKENTELEERSAKLAHLEGQVTSLEQVNSQLSAHVKTLTKQLKMAQDEGTKAKAQCEDLLNKVGKMNTGVEQNGSDAEKIAGLEIALQEWTELAKRSYEEYKQMLPTYKQADQYRKDALDKAETIEQLTTELTKAKATQSNGDVSYWKNKYESLLASISG